MKHLFHPLSCVGLASAFLWLTPPVLHADSIHIPNASFEEPAIADVENASFDGHYGNVGVVPGWYSNESSLGGAIHHEERYPGRTGDNVLYIHGSGDQYFHTTDFDLGVELQSNTTYVLTFDVLRWHGVTENDSVIFRAGLYTGFDYESRVPLKEISGQRQLVDGNGYPVDKIVITLIYTTGQVESGTRFWIGGDAFGNAEDRHRPHFDNFSLNTETK